MHAWLYKGCGFCTGLSVPCRKIGISTNDFIIHCPLGSPKPPDKTASRVFTACCWFLIITLLATYSGNLVAFSTMRKVRLPVRNLEELAAHSEYQAGVSSGGSTISLFRVSEQTYQSRHSFNIHIRDLEESKVINQEMLLTQLIN